MMDALLVVVSGTMFFGMFGAVGLLTWSLFPGPGEPPKD